MGKQLLLSLFFTLVAGCSMVPATSIEKPLSMRPDSPPPVNYNNGAIFQAENYRLNLFEDRKPGRVGDMLTIVIEEKVAASSKASNTASRKGTNAVSAAGLTVPFFPNYLDQNLAKLNVDTSGETKHEGKGEVSNSNSFSGSITVTVVEVLPNGNLLVGGEKQITLGQEAEYLRFSGVVNPSDIKAGNLISSTKVADARIEQKGSGGTSAVQAMGWLSRVFLSILPF